MLCVRVHRFSIWVVNFHCERMLLIESYFGYNLLWCAISLCCFRMISPHSQCSIVYSRLLPPLNICTHPMQGTLFFQPQLCCVAFRSHRIQMDTWIVYECSVIVGLMRNDLILTLLILSRQFIFSLVLLKNLFILCCQIFWHIFTNGHTCLCIVCVCVCAGVSKLINYTYQMAFYSMHTKTYKRTSNRKIYDHTYLMGRTSENILVLFVELQSYLWAKCAMCIDWKWLVCMQSIDSIRVDSTRINIERDERRWKRPHHFVYYAWSTQLCTSSTASLHTEMRIPTHIAA